MPLHRRNHECRLERSGTELRVDWDDRRMARDLLSDCRTHLLCDHVGSFGSTSPKPNHLHGEDDILCVLNHWKHHSSLHGQPDRSKLEKRSRLFLWQHLCTFLHLDFLQVNGVEGQIV